MVEATDSPEQSLLIFALRWLDHLSVGDLEAACAMLDEPNYYGVRFDPASLTQLFQESYDLDSVTDISRPTETAGKPRWSCLARSDGSGYDFEIDVPLCGTWSDLTAQFEFRSRPAGLAASLEDLHVL